MIEAIAIGIFVLLAILLGIYANLRTKKAEAGKTNSKEDTQVKRRAEKEVRPMKDVDARQVIEWDAFWREGSMTGEKASRLLELQKVYERYPRVWTWVDTTVANVPEVPDLILSFVYFKLLKLLSEANESEHKLKDIKSRHVPLFSSPIPKTAGQDTLSLYEWAKKNYPNCVMWYGLSIARDIQEGKTFGGFYAANMIAILVEMLEQANAG